MKYFIYKKVHEKDEETYVSRRYYSKKFTSSDCKKFKLTYCGEGVLNDEYFITGSETKHFEIIDLSKIELQYKAKLKKGKVHLFSHTLERLIQLAKEGVYTYLSFEGFKVQKTPKVIIHGLEIKEKRYDTIFYDTI